ncbi:MAG: CheR family methyltransferase, partial [Isosphaeraceae bacterium]
MPQSAVATGLADYVLPVERMPNALLQYLQHDYINGGRRIETAPDSADYLTQALALIRTRAKFDFRCYRKKMLSRRIERRMGLSHFDGFPEYLKFLRENPDELKHLTRDLFISVTSFFRDPEAFQHLASEVIAPLVRRKENDGLIRVWVPGCATGEEPYSIAILLLEHLAAAHKSCRLQVFATDVDDESLETARQGLYPDTIAADVSPERLARFFNRTEEHVLQVSKQLRETVIFAVQNLISDAPFTKLDLICCRNLLIYLEPEVQRKLITLFHFALSSGGVLFLGPSETIGRQVDLFEPLSRKWRIYKRIGPSRPDRVDFPIAASLETRSAPRPDAESLVPPHMKLADVAQRLLLEHFVPASVLINRKYEVLYYHGPCAQYLEFPAGAPTTDLIMSAREGLRSKLRGIIHQAFRHNETVVTSDVRVKRNGGFQRVRVTVRPVHSPKAAEGLLLVTFEDEAPLTQPPSSLAEDSLVESSADFTLHQLERELKATREDLQSTIEEMESSNEEIKASNEEVMSMNEELQSANEELETSKEELQSLNEELTTVNNQLQEKISELEAASNDMANLLNCTDIATIFLDTSLRIKRFTPAATRLFHLIATDLGRPIADITHCFTDSNLLVDAREVLERLVPREQEVSSTEGGCWIRRIVPYRTLDHRIEGVVLTFNDVTQIKRADEQERRLATVLQQSNDAILVHDFTGQIMAWNRGAERLYGFSEAESLEMNVDQIIPDDLRSDFHRTWDRLRLGEIVESWESQAICKSGRRLDVSISVTALNDGGGQPTMIARTDRDVSEMKRARVHLEQEVERRTAALREGGERMRAIHDNALAAIITMDSQGVIQTVNQGAETMFGYAAEEMLGKSMAMLMTPPEREEHEEHPWIFHESGEADSIGIVREVRARRRDGSPLDVALCVTRAAALDLFIVILLDISLRKQLEREVVEIATLEQKRIGENLHDNCGQELTALGLLADSLVQNLEEKNPDTARVAHKLDEGIRRVLRQVRGLSRGLALAEVKPAELSEALTELTAHLCETTNIR